MTIQQALNRIKRYLQTPSNCPNDTVATLTGYDGLRTLTVNINMVPGQWVGGIVKLGDGNAYDRAVIATNSANQLVLYDGFDVQAPPTLNQPVTLSKGPLGQANIMAIPREDIQSEIVAANGGPVYFVDIMGQRVRVGLASIGRDRPTGGGHQKKRYYQVLITAMVPDVISTNVVTKLEAALALPTIIEQIECQLRAFTANPSEGPFVTEDNFKCWLDIGMDMSVQLEGGPRMSAVGMAFEFGFNR